MLHWYDEENHEDVGVCQVVIMEESDAEIDVTQCVGGREW